MSDFEQEVPRPDASFLEIMRAADESIIGDMAEAQYRVIVDHQRMKDAVYWLRNNGVDPEADETTRQDYTETATEIAGRLAVHGHPMDIGEVVSRYVDMTPVGRPRRG